MVVIAVGKRPASIPNLEAKPTSADGTAPARVWESRTPPPTKQMKAPTPQTPHQRGVREPGPSTLNTQPPARQQAAPHTTPRQHRPTNNKQQQPARHTTATNRQQQPARFNTHTTTNVAHSNPETYDTAPATQPTQRQHTCPPTLQRNRSLT